MCGIVSPAGATVDVLRGYPSPTGGLAPPDVFGATNRVVLNKIPCIFCFACIYNEEYVQWHC